ncbi:hypothetical protein [Streptomyces sp. NPDC050600]|uniref:hypothetical protein n=1 Tax=Streptomyces sp. NPDC050600 TaxID=3157213 RepID=UPI0034226E9D
MTLAPDTTPSTALDKNLDAACADIESKIIGVRAGSYRLLVSITAACQQAGAGLPVRRSMV